MPKLSPSAWSALRDAALAMGFADLGATAAEDLGRARARAFPGSAPTAGLDEWLDAGHAGEMTYLDATRTQRQDPRAWWPPARTALVGLVPHDGEGEPGDGEEAGARARISRYAWGRDYHVVVKTMLMALGRRLEREVPGAQWRTSVDRGASMEKPLAVLAGLGWIGKHGNLLRTTGSSWFFIGVLLTDVEVDPNEPFTAEHCGTCTACIEACPTSAIVGPQVVDATRCVSYLTIEVGGAVDRSLRPGMGAWVHGCDACQDACPWNRHRTRTGHPRFAPGALGRGPSLDRLLHLDDAAFTAATPKSALKRERRGGLVRNALIAAGNSGDLELVEPAAELLSGDPDPVVRSHAAWALGRLGGAAARGRLQAALSDADGDVRAEIASALDESSGEPPRSR